jgi:hypothetical protein
MVDHGICIPFTRATSEKAVAFNAKNLKHLEQFPSTTLQSRADAEAKTAPFSSLLEEDE